MLTALLNEIATVPDEFVLVLDDYHVVEAKPVDDVLTFLLDQTGILWIGTKGGGVNRFNPATGQAIGYRAADRQT